jgi:hypothetical protein
MAQNESTETELELRMNITIDQAQAAVDRLTKSHRDIEELIESLQRERNEIAVHALSDQDAGAQRQLKELNRQTGSAVLELENLTASDAAPPAQETSAKSRSESIFYKNRFAVLDRILLDHPKERLAFQVAYRLMTKYLNKESGEAFMKQKTLAKELGVTERSIRTAVAFLVDHGYLVITRPTRHSNNRYRPNPETAVPTGTDVPVTAASDGSTVPIGQEAQFLSDRKHTSYQTGSTLPIYINPTKEPSDSNPTSQPNKSTAVSEKVPAGFDEWFDSYPRKVARDAARREYEAVIREGRATPAELLVGAQVYAAMRSGEDETYTKYPNSFLRDEHWRDLPKQKPNMRRGEDGRLYAEHVDPRLGW